MVDISRKIPYVQIKDYIEQTSQSECRLLTPEANYGGVDAIIRLQCPICKEPFQTTVTAFKYRRKHKCNKCSLLQKVYPKKRKSRGLKYPYNYIKEFIEVGSNSGCKLLSDPEDYTSYKAVLTLECLCGIQFCSSFSRFINKRKPKRQCNGCAQASKRVTYETARAFIEVETQSGCILLASSQGPMLNGVRTELSLKCACGEPFTTTYTQIQSGKRCCNSCAKHIIWTEEDIKQYVEVESSSGCKVKRLLKSKARGETTKNETCLDLECACGRPFYKTFSDFKDRQGFQCRICANEQRANQLRYTEDLVRQIAQDKGVELMSPYSNYSNIASRLLFTCTCGDSFVSSIKALTDRLKPKDRCDRCTGSLSKGEARIREWLNAYGDWDYEIHPQHRIVDCRRKNSLPFDVALFHNERLITLIEYHGKQHYGAIDYYGGIEGFLYRTENDAIKFNYCLESSIPLLIISYREYHQIGRILEQWLSSLELSSQPLSS